MEIKTAYIFPGQGSQIVGMGKDFYESFGIAKQIIDEADQYVDFDLKDIMFNGPTDELKQTHVAQIALYTISVAIFNVLPPEKKISCVAGHSLGEYSALHIAKSFSFLEGIDLIKKRGKLMRQSSDPEQGMMSVIGHDLNTILINMDSNIEIACYNSFSQVVLSGLKTDLESYANKIKDQVKRIVMLPVSGAFHSKYMKKASQEFKAFLDKKVIHKPELTFISNVIGKITNNEDIKDLLCQQIINPVRWVDTIQEMEKKGVSQIIEIGSQSVLTNLGKNIAPNCSHISIKNLESLNNFCQI